MIKIIIEKICNVIYLIKDSFIWIIFALDFILILFTINNGWHFLIVILFICFQFVIDGILEPIRNETNLKKFLPDKPEKDGIRYLRGRDAIEFLTIWDRTNIFLEPDELTVFFLETRRKLLKLLRRPMNYFTERQLLEPYERRCKDLEYIKAFKHKTTSKYYRVNRFIDRLRYYYLKFRYRNDLRRKRYWVEFNDGVKNLGLVWHEDVEKYEKLH